MGNELLEHDATVRERHEEKYKKPRKWNVILHNDDFTPMEFVTALLVSVFKKTYEDANSITLQVHRKGRGIAGTYTHEIAETKATQVLQYAQRHEHPLQVSIEPIDEE